MRNLSYFDSDYDLPSKKTTGSAELTVADVVVNVEFEFDHTSETLEFTRCFVGGIDANHYPEARFYKLIKILIQEKV